MLICYKNNILAQVITFGQVNSVQLEQVKVIVITISCEWFKIYTSIQLKRKNPRLGILKTWFFSIKSCCDYNDQSITLRSDSSWFTKCQKISELCTFYVPVFSPIPLHTRRSDITTCFYSPTCTNRLTHSYHGLSVCISWPLARFHLSYLWICCCNQTGFLEDSTMHNIKKVQL